MRLDSSNESLLGILFVAIASVGCHSVLALAEPIAHSSPTVRWASVPAELRQSPAEESEAVGTVSQGTMLAVLSEETGEHGARFIYVKPLEVSRINSGWVLVKETSFISPRKQSSNRSPDSEEVLPILIQRLPQPQQADFRRLSAAIKVAEAAKIFIPDLFVARAELWAIAGETNESLKDYRMAASHALMEGASSAEQIDQLRNLCDSLERQQSSPRPAEGIEPTDHATAAKHYGEGYTLFWSNLTEEAEKYFQNAIMLNPADPRYWYFRGLARRRRGDLSGAQHDVLVAAFLERSMPKSSVVPHALMRCQGADRFWLETFRLGDPTQQLLHLELAEVTVGPGASP
jgi:tetratricopeptide (TPR) repeat protein